MTEFVSFVGIDGSGKTSISMGASQIMGEIMPTGLVGSIDEQSYFMYRKNQNFLYPELVNKVAALYRTEQDLDRRNQRIKGNALIMQSLVAHTKLTGRLIEPKLKRQGAEIILRDRDPFIDPIVVFQLYFGFYMPLLIPIIRAVSNPERTNLLFLLNVEAETALARLKTSEKLDSHESIEKLKKARRLYIVAILQFVKNGLVDKTAVINTEYYNIPNCVSQAVSGINTLLITR